METNHADKLINLYNKLTDIDYMSNDDNFLKSIKYKMQNGNKILKFLSALEDKYIPFRIVKGFLVNDEKYSKFERCLIFIETNADLSDLNSNEITINLVDDHLYEILIRN